MGHAPGTVAHDISVLVAEGLVKRCKMKKKEMWVATCTYEVWHQMAQTTPLPCFSLWKPGFSVRTNGFVRMDKSDCP